MSIHCCYGQRGSPRTRLPPAASVAPRSARTQLDGWMRRCRQNPWMGIPRGQRGRPTPNQAGRASSETHTRACCRGARQPHSLHIWMHMCLHKPPPAPCVVLAYLLCSYVHTCVPACSSRQALATPTGALFLGPCPGSRAPVPMACPSFVAVLGPKCYGDLPYAPAPRHIPSSSTSIGHPTIPWRLACCVRACDSAKKPGSPLLRLPSRPLSATVADPVAVPIGVGRKLAPAQETRPPGTPQPGGGRL